MFPLAYALTELLLDCHYLCCSSTIDFRQWATSIVRPFEILRSMIDERIKELKSEFALLIDSRALLISFKGQESTISKSTFTFCDFQFSQWSSQIL